MLKSTLATFLAVILLVVLVAQPSVVTAEGYDGRRTSMEIVLAYNDLCLAFFDPFYLVSPFAGEFNGGLHSFHTRVHR